MDDEYSSASAPGESSVRTAVQDNPDGGDRLLLAHVEGAEIRDDVRLARWLGGRGDTRRRSAGERSASPASWLHTGPSSQSAVAGVVSARPRVLQCRASWSRSLTTVEVKGETARTVCMSASRTLPASALRIVSSSLGSYSRPCPFGSISPTEAPCNPCWTICSVQLVECASTTSRSRFAALPPSLCLGFIPEFRNGAEKALGLVEVSQSTHETGADRGRKQRWARRRLVHLYREKFAGTSRLATS